MTVNATRNPTLTKRAPLIETSYPRLRRPDWIAQGGRRSEDECVSRASLATPGRSRGGFSDQARGRGAPIRGCGAGDDRLETLDPASLGPPGQERIQSRHGRKGNDF